VRSLLIRLVVAALVATAALAIGVLLFGDFGETEGKVLATTALLAGFGLVSLPAALLFDQQRRVLLAGALVVAAAVAVALTLVGLWGEGDSETYGRAVGSAWIVTLVLVQTAGLTAGRRRTGTTRRLFAASTAVAVFAGALALVLLWSEAEGWGARVLAALVVADLLLVALQPLLARSATAGGAPGVRRVTIEGDDAAIEAAAAAAAAAGGRVVAGGNAARRVEH
jgi:hypothetical protein